MDDCIRKMQQTQALLGRRVISVIERFEEIRDRAGWPNDPLKGQERPRDPAAPPLESVFCAPPR